MILGLIALAAGVYGFYAVAQTGEVLEKNILLACTLLFGSLALAGSGLHLLIEPELKEKAQTKLGEQ